MYERLPNERAAPVDVSTRPRSLWAPKPTIIHSNNAFSCNILNRRLHEPDFELTKPSTGQAYNDTTKQPKERKRKQNWGYQLTIQAQVMQSYSLNQDTRAPKTTAKHRQLGWNFKQRAATPWSRTKLNRHKAAMQRTTITEGAG
jgi:hypothetical protein